MKVLLTVIIVIVASIVLYGCASSPSRVNELAKDNDNLGLDIVLNGQLVKLDDKFTLGNFYVAVSSIKQHANGNYVSSALPNQSNSISVTQYSKSPSDPWEFNGKTLFPAIEIHRTHCINKGGCVRRGTKPKICPDYEKQESPFIRVVTSWSGSGDTYSERLDKIKVNEYSKMTPTDVAALLVAAPLIAVLSIPFIPNIPRAIFCTMNEKSVEFDHDKFYDTVKAAIIAEYGSIKEYISDIQHASIVYKRLKAANDRAAKEVENAIRIEESRIQQLARDNYQLDYTIYILDKIPRQADWETYQVTIEKEIAAHYKEQLESINRQLDAHHETIYQRHGVKKPV